MIVNELVLLILVELSVYEYSNSFLIIIIYVPPILCQFHTDLLYSLILFSATVVSSVVI